MVENQESFGQPAELISKGAEDAPVSVSGHSALSSNNPDGMKETFTVGKYQIVEV